MKYRISCNQDKAIDLGITNINQALILDLLMSCSTWATPEMIDGDVYYWVARQQIVSELPLLNMKPDTVYRHLRSLEKLGLISYRKNGKKDCIKITRRGKSYYVGFKSEKGKNAYVGNESEKPPNSDLNPSKLGNESEKHSDLNPTYPYTNPYQDTNNPQQEGVDERKPFVMHSEWLPTIDERIFNQLTMLKVTQGDIDTRLIEYRIHHMNSPGHKRTQHNWSRSFISTVIKFKQSGISNANKNSPRFGKDKFDAFTELAKSALEQ